MSETPKRRVVRSIGGTYDYIFEDGETICILPVPSPETPEYSRRVAEILALPDTIYDLAASHEVLDAARIANADDGQVMTLCERVEKLVGLFLNYVNEVSS
jgi:hypothetical protein